MNDDRDAVDPVVFAERLLALLDTGRSVLDSHGSHRMDRVDHRRSLRLLSRQPRSFPRH